MMNVFLALCLCGLSIALSAQTTLQTFTSQDGVFRFKYSRALVRCTPEQVDRNSNEWFFLEMRAWPAMTAQAVPAPSLALPTPKDKFKDKPTFLAAGFFVAEAKDVATENACLVGSRYWNTEDVKRAKIGGVNFKAFHVWDWGLGDGQEGHIYRTFHNRRGYELGIQMASSSAGNFDAGTIKGEDGDYLRLKDGTRLLAGKHSA